LLKSTLSASERDEIAKCVVDAYTSSNNVRDHLLDIWQRNVLIHYSLPEYANGASIYRGNIPKVHVPIAQPRADRLASKITSIIGRQPTFLSCSSTDTAAKVELDRLVHETWRRAGFRQLLQQAADFAVDTNYAIWKVQPVQLKPRGASAGMDKSDKVLGLDKDYAGVSMEVINPAKFFFAPVTKDGLKGATVIGEVKQIRVKEIKALMLRGEVYKDVDPEFMVTDFLDAELREAVASNRGTQLFGHKNDEELPKVLDALVKWGKPGKEVWLHVLVHHASQKLLRAEDYQWSRPWYFTGSLMTDNSEWWSERSVMRQLGNLQVQYDTLFSAHLMGVINSAAPPIYGPPQEDKTTFYGAMEYIPVEPGQSPFAPSGIYSANGSTVQTLVMIERVADQVCHINSNTLGATESREISATQTEEQSSGARDGIEGFISNFTEQFGEMAMLTVEYWGQFGDEWKVYYEDALGDPLDFIQSLDEIVTWEASGKAPSDTITAKLVVVQQALQIYGALGDKSGIDPTKLASQMLKLLGDEFEDVMATGDPGLAAGIGDVPGGLGPVSPDPNMESFAAVGA
jgi:hypothetical protein